MGLAGAMTQPKPGPTSTTTRRRRKRMGCRASTVRRLRPQGRARLACRGTDLGSPRQVFSPGRQAGRTTQGRQGERVAKDIPALEHRVHRPRGRRRDSWSPALRCPRIAGVSPATRALAPWPSIRNASSHGLSVAAGSCVRTPWQAPSRLPCMPRPWTMRGRRSTRGRAARGSPAVTG